MTQKYVKTPIPPEISDKGGATIQFVDRQTVPLETSVKEAIEGLFVLGQEQLVKSNFFGLMRSASDGIRRDGHARQIGDYITIYPVVTGEFDLDRGWDPERNGVRIIARLLNELELDITKWSFEDATPGKQSFKVNTVSTLGVEGLAEVGKPIAINGSGLPKTDAIRVDWAVEGTDKSGTIPAAKVTSDDVRADIAADALAELDEEEYDGKAIVFTVRGNFSSAKIAATLRMPTEPVIDSLDSTLGRNMLAETAPFTVNGRRLGNARKLTLEYVNESGVTTETDWTPVTPSDDGRSIEVEQILGIPHGIDASHPASVKLYPEGSTELLAELGGITWVP